MKLFLVNGIITTETLSLLLFVPYYSLSRRVHFKL